MDDPGVIELIASLPVSPANRTLSPESAPEPQTTDGSGPIPLESSAKSTPLLYPSKTSLGCSETQQPAAILKPTGWMTTQMNLLGGWEPFCGIWPQWGLCLCGEVFELRASEPRTDGVECSFWPTSRAEDSESTGAHRGNLDTLHSAVQNWPTPMADIFDSGPNNRYQRQDSKAGRQLKVEAAEWPTPDAGIYGGMNRSLSPNAATRPALASASEQWPTPNSRDEKNPGSPTGERAQRKAEHGWTTDLNDASVQWQTPATDSFRSRGGDRVNEMGLDQQARFWASPQARDYRSGETIEDYGNSRPLNEQVVLWGTPTSHTRTSTPRDVASGIQLANQVHNWNTPQFQDSEQAGTAKRATLNRDATLWTTPHGLQYRPEAGDPGGGGEFAEQATTWTPSLPALLIPPGLTFSARVRILLLLCRRLRERLPSPYNKASSLFRRKLNPDFVDWLMGWPDGWSNDGRVFSAAEMESYLCRQRSLLRSLLPAPEFSTDSSS